MSTSTPGLSSHIADLVIYRDAHGLLLNVREYLPTDRPGLQHFYEQFEPKRVAQGLPPEGVERIRGWLTSVLSTGIHLVALRGAEVVGHALVMPTSRPGIGEYAVFLRKDLRGRGIGATLNLAAVEAAKRAGMRGLWLSVEPHNRAAIRSYEKAGFRLRPVTAYSLEAEMELGWG